MPEIPSITEQQLSRLSPSGLEDEFIERLAACADGSMLGQTADEIDFEKMLRGRSAKRIPSDLNSKLMVAIGDTPFAVDEKIVLFNRSGAKDTVGKTKPFGTFRTNVAAAAAVALLGSLAALMIPTGDGNGRAVTEKNATDRDLMNGTAIPSPVSSRFVPAGFNRNLSDTRDGGVVWGADNVPYRHMHFMYTDRFTMENDRGETFEMVWPWSETGIIPEKID